MANKYSEGYILTTKFYNIANYATILAPKKWNSEEKSDINPEGTTVKKQDNTTTKQILMWNIHSNELHTNVRHPGEYMMCVIIRHLQTCSSPRQTFFYTRSHLSALQNCALLFSTNFQFIFILKECITHFSHWIVSCPIFFKNIVQAFIKFTHSFGVHSNESVYRKKVRLGLEQVFTFTLFWW